MDPAQRAKLEQQKRDILREIEEVVMKIIINTINFQFFLVNEPFHILLYKGTCNDEGKFVLHLLFPGSRNIKTKVSFNFFHIKNPIVLIQIYTLFIVHRQQTSLRKLCILDDILKREQPKKAEENKN